MSKLIISFCILFLTNLVFSNDITLTHTQHVQAKKIESGCSGTSYVAGSKDVAIQVGISCGTNKIENHFTVSVCQFNLSSIPPNATDINATLEAALDPNDHGTNVSITYANDNITWNNYESVYGSIGTSIMILSRDCSTSSYNVTSAVISKLQQGYINFGATPTGDFEPATAMILIQLKISFTVPPLSIIADNNFTDNSGNQTRGSMIIDGTTRTIPSIGYSITKTVNQSAALQAITSQTDNEGRQRIWHTGSFDKSTWTRSGAFLTNSQTCNRAIIADDNGRIFLANYKQIKTTTSGTLSSNENWFTNVTLTNNVTVPPGITLNLTSDATVNLNGYSILSTGGTITNNATVTGLKALLKSSGVIKGIYPTIESALNAASSGNVVEVKNSNSLSGNVTVPSGVTLTITSSASITLGSYSITTTSGTISVQSGATVNPYIPLKQSSAIKGLYPTVQTAVNAASSGSTVELQNTTYSGSVSFSSKSGITLSGAGSSVISSGISLTNSSSISISGMRMSNGPSINGGSSNTFINSTVTGSTVTSNYNASETSIYYITAENIEASFGVNSYNGSGTMIYSDIQNGDCAVYLTNSADWDIRTGNEFCGNGYDVYAVSPAYAYVTDNTSYSSSSPVYGNVDLEQTPIYLFVVCQKPLQ